MKLNLQVLSATALLCVGQVGHADDIPVDCNADPENFDFLLAFLKPVLYENRYSNARYSRARLQEIFTHH